MECRKLSVSIERAGKNCSSGKKEENYLRADLIARRGRRETVAVGGVSLLNFRIKVEKDCLYRWPNDAPITRPSIPACRSPRGYFLRAGWAMQIVNEMEGPYFCAGIHFAGFN